MQLLQTALVEALVLLCMLEAVVVRSPNEILGPYLTCNIDNIISFPNQRMSRKVRNRLISRLRPARFSPVDRVLSALYNPLEQ